MQLSAAIDLYLASCRRRGRSPATLANYAHHLHGMSSSIGDVEIGAVTLDKLRSWIDGQMARGLKPRSVWSAVVCCQAFWRWLVAEGLVSVSPAARLERPRIPEAIPKALELEEICDLFAAAAGGCSPERDRALLAFLVDTGVRRSGVASLLTHDLHLADGYAQVVAKGGAAYWAFYSAPTGEMLRAWLDVRNPDLFKRSVDPRSVFGLTGSGIQQRIERLAADACICRRVGAHSLRHTCAVMRVEQGIDSAALMQVMGWRDLRMAEVYTRLAKHRLRRLALETSPMQHLPIKD
jgi:integrase/recombinase XerC